MRNVTIVVLFFSCALVLLGSLVLVEAAFPGENGKIIESPLEQYKSGVFPQDIQCKEGFDLIFKSKSGWIPACVKPDTAEKLLERGWTSMIMIFSSKT